MTSGGRGRRRRRPEVRLGLGGRGHTPTGSRTVLSGSQLGCVPRGGEVGTVSAGKLRQRWSWTLKGRGDPGGAGPDECVGRYSPDSWDSLGGKGGEVDALVTLRSLAGRDGLEGQEARGAAHSPGAPHDGADPGGRAGGARRGPSLHCPGPGR